MVEIIQRIVSERLYLVRDGVNEIFVNDCQLLKQHQINGLRFLFKQYKKKKHGVIVNFPSHCGKSVTVVLFLHAIRSLLKKPVLILCKDVNEMQVWRKYFSKWTDFNDDDIVVESTKLLKGKRIFIKEAEGLTSYQHHSWSIVIAKDDLINEKMCQITDAEYKIWITSTDMKKDLAMLAFIYKWMYPKLKFNAMDFTPSTKKPKEMLIKSIYLDTFLEDFVIREYNIKQFDETKKSISLNADPNKNNENKLKKSRKNKDETGNKIKRSRIIINEEETVINDNEVTTNNQVKNVGFVANDSDRHSDIKLNNIGIKDLNVEDEIVIPDSEEYHRKCLDQNLTAHVPSVVDTRMDVDSTEQINFRDAINEIIKIENVIQTENSTESFDSNHNGNKTNIALESNKESLNADENIIMQQSISDNSVSIVQSIENVDVVEEKCMDVIDNVEKVTHLDTTKRSVKCHNSIDTKLSELEEITLKKFKGSFLDNIF